MINGDNFGVTTIYSYVSPTSANKTIIFRGNTIGGGTTYYQTKAMYNLTQIFGYHSMSV